jgi:uncharacterized membrane protein
MTFQRAGQFGFIAWAMFVGAPAGIAETIYSYSSIDVPGATGTYAFGVNSAGQIVGSYFDSAGGYHGFVDSNGTFTTLNFPAAPDSTSLQGISATGDIVGYFDDPAAPFFTLDAFLYSTGVFSVISVPGATNRWTVAFGISDNGQIVGTVETPADQGFVGADGVFTTFVYPGSTGTDAHGINDSGQTVGIANFSPRTSTGFIYTSGSFADINFPGIVDATNPWAINDAGQVVGFFVEDGSVLGFLDTAGAFTRIIDPLGPKETRAYGINSYGEIVGNYYDSNGVSHGFLAVPVPEPRFLPLLVWIVAGATVVTIERWPKRA